MLENKNVLVIGTGISGIGATGLLQSQNAKVSMYDDNELLDIEKVRKQLLKPSEILFYLKKIPKEKLITFDLVVLSPGIPLDSQVVVLCQGENLPILGEIELACLQEQGKLIGISGTNGKTTTTTLVGEMMKAFYQEVFVVGNIGNPYTLEVLKTNKNSVTVAELSSFQLETIHKFKPHISAILNITPDHLNRHYTMENYVKAKANLAKNQGELDYCILNYDNEYTRNLAQELTTNIIWFSAKEQLDDGYFLEDNYIVRMNEGKKEVYLNVKEDMNLVGTCNYENVMAAIAIAIEAKVPKALILQVIKNFKAVEHRIEFVATKKGVDYYNDSKGTNPDAAIQGIKAMSKPTVLIGGGYDKGSDYQQWIRAFDGNVTSLILIGETKEKIAQCAKEEGFFSVVLVDSFQEACEYATKCAKEGEAVLLSPACASWGMFPNYEARGNAFKEYVNKIKE